MKPRFLFHLTAALCLSACGMANQNSGSTQATSTAEAGSQRRFVATMVAQTLTALLPTATADPTSTTVTTPTTTNLPLPTYKDTFFGIQVTLPNDSWTCTIQPVNDNTGAIFDEVIHLKSNLFTIDISDLGRDEYCWNEPGQSGCVVTEFHKNNLVTLNSYSIDGKLGEIFGLIKDKAWISIHYEGMESRELTGVEKQELIQLIDSITFTK